MTARQPEAPTSSSSSEQPPETVVESVVATVTEAPTQVVRGLASAVLRRLPADEAEPGKLSAVVAHGARVLAERDADVLAVHVTSTGQATVVDVNVEDVPLLLSTALAELDARGLPPREVLHPVLGVEREASGRLRAIMPARTAAQREAWLHLRLDPLDDEVAGDLQAGLRRALEAARQVHADLPEMRRHLGDAEAAFRAHGEEEAAALVRWLLADRLVILGVARGEPGPRLGLLRDGLEGVVPGDSAAPVRVGRTLEVSPVHRRERMVDLRLGAVRAVGLFSSQAYADSVGEVPLARDTLARTLDAEDLVEGSHDERSLRALFTSLPLDVQLGADPADLRRTLVPLLAAQRAQEVTLRCRVDSAGKAANVVVTLPRSRFSPQVRERVQAALIERLGGAEADYHLSITREDWVLLHFVVHAPEGAELSEPRLEGLQRAIVALTRTSKDAIRAALREQRGPREATRLAQRWLDRLPSSYVDQVPVHDAVTDLVEIDALEAADGRMRMHLAASEQGRWRARLYLRGQGIELSTLLPVLESLGLVVVDEIPYRILDWGHLHDVRLRAPEPLAASDAHGPAGAQAALAMLGGRAEADELNRLVLSAGLRWDDVAVLRAYRRYRRQVGTGFTDAYQNAALCEHTDFAKALIDLFAAKLDPRLTGPAGDEPTGGGADDRRDAVEDARKDVAVALEKVTRLDQDRILRGYLGLVEATVRTSRYLEPDRSWLALKLDSARVPDVGKPVPHAETFVYAPDLEGVHLRGGPVARGGLRHSDRLEDVRGEVLGLMKAQMTKNALIVPVGAKGGFVLKPHPFEGEPVTVRSAYERFIGALLDITDDIVDGRPVHPAGVRATDGFDPYLVVAPDRGTGTLSDVANAIAIERGFWLGDAFASGGSSGYDHKAMGITARGAWVAVRRHFTELGIDVDRDPTRVIGIGDMSGDVFGNALLQSRATRLVAAFDHRHVFLDPEPDADRAYAERARLFAEPGSSWQDFDRQVLSEGGGVWSRTVKSIPLSAPVRTLLRVDAESLSPPELVRAILRAPADLLFAGGIGTFVKATDEAHSDVGDRVNDAIRVDASELGVRVVGEGANLALSQRARVQYSRRGGRCNSDAIDNAAGVATSDAEVNLKILLADADAEGMLAHGERDTLLAGARDEVAARVLADVDAQTRALSRELVQSPGGLDAYEELMADLEERGRLDRLVEALPEAAEIARRQDAGAGLTRPELAVLLAHAKLDLRDALLDSELPDDPGVKPLLHGYLPASLRERFADLVGMHRLRRELVATRLANTIVDDMGITWARRAAEEVGLTLWEAARAYWVAREVTGAAALLRAAGALGSEVDTTVVWEVDAAIRGLLDGCARAYARQERVPPTAEQLIGRDSGPARDMTAALLARGAPRREVALTRWVDAGVPADLAQRVVALPGLAALPDVAAVARGHSRPVTDVVAAFAVVTERLPLARLERVLDRIEPAGRWSRWQREGLVDELRRIRRDAAAGALVARAELSGPEAVAARLEERADERSRVERLVTDLERGEDGLDGVAVAVRALRDAVGS